MPAIDAFQTSQPGLVGQAVGGEVVVPHNANEQSFVSRAVYVGVSGTVVALMADGSVLTFVGMPVGIHPLRCKRINATGTTATNLMFLR